MKLIRPLTNSLLIASAATTLNAQAQTPVTLTDDIKPTLVNDEFDEEIMRMTKIIHKRITKKQASENKSNKTAFNAYNEKISSDESLDLLPIKGGSFTWQGEQADDKLEVSLSPFWMAKKEITWQEYSLFMHPELKREKDGYLIDYMRAQIEDEIDFLARPTPQYHPLANGMPRDGYPMISMTQHAANKYCQWLSYKTGHFYRLPTEAEWEYACLAGSNTKYSWGNDPAEGNKYAWFGGNDKTNYNKPGLKQANAWGLLDMHGNVMEWTLDQYVPNRKKYFAKTKVHNPWVKATKPYPHVTKGGHWMSRPAQLTANARHKSHPKWKIKDPQEPKSIFYHTSAQTVGFRIVRPEKTPSVEEMYHYWNNGVAEDGVYTVYEKGHPLYSPEE